MFDTRSVLHDMALRIRAFRVEDELTLQMLATRCGVAASTIHKVESESMVPTISVFLRIAKGLGKRPDELIRDVENRDDQPSAYESSARTDQVGVWHIDLNSQKSLPALKLNPLQRAIVLVERGRVRIIAGSQLVSLETGDCIAVDGGRIQSNELQEDPARLTLIVSPPGDLGRSLGEPSQFSQVYR